MEHHQLNCQIESMGDWMVTEFLDAYQCADWGVNATQFGEKLIAHLSEVIRKVAQELDTPEED